jgi:NADPH:quinone reductase-like Zn-dependent oxidoreductase
MWAIEAKTFSGYGGLRRTEFPKPEPATDRVLVRVMAAGVTPLNGSVKPIVERVHPFGEAGEALRHLIEDRPFGKVVLAR